MGRVKERRIKRVRPWQVVDLDAEVRLSDAIGCFYIEPWQTVYAIDFGDSSTAFYQDECGFGDDDDDEPWFTGLYILPDSFDATSESATYEAGGPGRERTSPDHLRFYGELCALGRRWRAEHKALESGGPLLSRDDCELELRALFDRWASHHPSKAVAGAPA